MNLNNAILEKFEHGLEKSASPNRFQAIINMGHYYAKLDIPEALKPFIDNVQDFDPSFFTGVKDLLPGLVQHYHQEALNKERIRILKHLKLDANNDLFKEIDTHLVTLFKGDISQENYEQTILSFKSLIVRERLKYHDIQMDESLITEGLRKNNLFEQLKNNSKKDINESTLHKITQSFLSVAHLSSPEAIQHKLVNDALTIANDDFKREILALNDIHETHFTGTERLFRGMKVDLTPELKERFFAEGTRMLEDDNDLFHFHVTNNWNTRSGDWEIGGSYFSFNPYFSVGFVGTNGILLEAVPHQGKKGMWGQNIGDWETIINNIEGNEIRTIYRFLNGKVIEVIKNPNFPVELDEKMPEPFHIGDNKEYIMGLDEILDYQSHFWVKKENKYTSIIEFEKKYTSSEVQIYRSQLLSERGFTSYTEKFLTCKEGQYHCYSIQELYQQLVLSSESQRNIILSESHIMHATDEQGHHLLMLAIIHDHVELLQFSLNHGFTLEGENHLHQNVYQIAAASGAINCMKSLEITQDIINENHLLDIAIMHRQEAFALFLINQGAATETFNLNGFKPGHLAAIKYMPHVLSVLIEKNPTMSKSQAHLISGTGQAQIDVTLTEIEIIGQYWDVRDILKNAPIIDQWTCSSEVYTLSFLKESLQVGEDLSLLMALLQRERTSTP